MARDQSLEKQIKCAEKYVHDKRYKEALKFYSQLYQQFPENIEIAKKYVFVLWENMDSDLALKVCESIIQFYPDDDKLKEYYGWSLIQKGKYHKAMQIYQKLLSMNPNSALLRGRYAITLQETGRIQQAQNQFLKALQIDSSDARCLNYYAMMLFSQQRYEEAEIYYEKAIERGERNEMYLTNYAIFLMKRGRLEEAKKQFKNSLEINPNQARCLYYYFETLQKLNQKSEAQKVKQKLIEIKKDQPGYRKITKAITQTQKTNLQKSLSQCNKIELYEVIEEYENDYFHVKLTYVKKNTANLVEDDLDENRLDYQNQKSKRNMMKIDSLQDNPLHLMKMCKYHLQNDEKKRGMECIKKVIQILNSKSKFASHTKPTQQKLANLSSTLDVYSEIEQIKKKQSFQTEESIKEERSKIQRDLYDLIRDSVQSSFEPSSPEGRQKMNSKLNFLKEEIKKLRKKVSNNEKQIQRLNDYVFAVENFNKKIRQKQRKIYIYAKQLCFVLFGCLQDYLRLRRGMIGEGDIIKTSYGKYAEKLKNIFEIGAIFPEIDKVCEVLQKITEGYIELSKEETINKMAALLNHFQTQNDLFKAVSESVWIIIEDKEHVELLKTEKESPWYEKYYSDIKNMRDKFLSIITGIPKLENQSQSTEAFQDCDVILNKMLKLEEKSKNPIEEGAKLLLEKKKKIYRQIKQEEEKKKKETEEREKKKKKANDAGCCIIF